MPICSAKARNSFSKTSSVQVSTLESLCKELKVDFKQIGSLVVASDSEQIETIHRLHKQATRRGIETKIINRDEILKMEKNISDDVQQALYCAQTGIVTPWKIAIAAMETAMANQCQCELNQEVIDIRKEKDVFVVVTKDKELLNRASEHFRKKGCFVRKTRIIQPRKELKD